jgi:ribosome maturation factor RimP
MDLVSYQGLKVHVVLIDKFFYIGKVLEADEDSLTLLDKNNRRVSVKKSSIASIKEVYF